MIAHPFPCLLTACAAHPGAKAHANNASWLTPITHPNHPHIPQTTDHNRDEEPWRHPCKAEGLEATLGDWHESGTLACLLDEEGG